MISRQLVQEGHLLFRHRGLLPLCLLIPLIWSYQDFQFLQGSSHLEHLWLSGCIVISVAGLALRVTTVGFVPAGTSGRNTQEQIALVLNTTGWYSVCRNPLYLGNYLIGLGIALAPHNPLMAAVYTSIFWLYYERIIAAEEGFLNRQFGEHYIQWARSTPVFIPALQRWQRPALPFCWRTAVRREYSALLLIGIIYPLLDVMEHWIAERQLKLDAPTSLLLLGGVSVAWTARLLKKRTQLLDVAGRC